jgi:3-oxoacyl-[acyl-carrier-protein] synthase-3
MKCHFQCSQIAGIATTLPPQSVDLLSLDALWDRRVLQTIIKATGINKVRVAGDGVTAADLCRDAAARLLEAMNCPADQIDGLILITQTPDVPVPATSALLQHRLGLKKNIVAFDINQGCNGYIYGLLQAELLIGAGACRHVLVCAGDTLASRNVGPRDRSTRMVFGDAGTATLVVPGNSNDYFNIHTDGSGAPHIIIRAGGARCPSTAETRAEKPIEGGNFVSDEHIYMNGMEVMGFAMREVPKIIDETLHDAGWTKDQVDLFALHQANQFMIDSLSRKMDLPAAVVPFGCAEIGNTSAASIPVMLCQEGEKLRQNRPLNRVVLCGFGVGLSWGAVATTFAQTQLIAPVDLESSNQRGVA